TRSIFFYLCYSMLLCSLIFPYPPTICLVIFSPFYPSPLCIFFSDPSTPELYTLSLHDALPIYPLRAAAPHPDHEPRGAVLDHPGDRKSTRLNSSHVSISYAVFCLKKKAFNIYPSFSCTLFQLTLSAFAPP